MVKIRENREFIEKCYENKIPVFIVTHNDDWIGGYITELSDIKFSILDWKENEKVEVKYSDVRTKKEFEGDFSKLPVPDNKKEEVKNDR